MSLVFFFKQEAAYEMRMSDWSSDVCSSDLTSVKRAPVAERTKSGKGVPQSSIQCIGTPENQWRRASFARASEAGLPAANLWRLRADRKSVRAGKSVSVRVDLGGRSRIKKKKIKSEHTNQQKKNLNSD